MKQEAIGDTIFCQLENDESSIIKYFSYKPSIEQLCVILQSDGVYVYNSVPINTFIDFTLDESFGSFYNRYIKQNFKSKNQTMATEKIQRRSIALKIDVTKLKKDWFFIGKENKDGDVPVYADLMLFFSDQTDVYGQNGFIVQAVPKALKKQDSTLRGAILGNAKDLTDFEREKLPKAGEEEGELAKEEDDLSNDLPF